MKDALEYYQVLQIAPDADSSIIKQSYRDLAKVWHPDYNQGQDTTDIFQKISVAYDVLSNPQTRLVYDILSLVYSKENYPDLEIMTPFVDEDDGVHVQAVSLKEVRAWFFGWKETTVFRVCRYKGAVWFNTSVAAANWLAGWWHPKAFVRNLKALLSNFKYPVNPQDSARILLHNMIAYAKENKPVLAAKCGLAAARFLSVEDYRLVEKFLSGLGVKVARPKMWSPLLPKIAQLAVPMCLLLGGLGYAAGQNMNLSEAELWNWFAKNKEIDYYQRVDFGGRGQSVDDVVVGKIMSIPLDKADMSKLYYLTAESKVMYGPSVEFDVIKILPVNTTVRLTGMTPDNVWARVMIDNGETGFVYMKDIKQGIGREIPFGSAIIE